MAGIQAPELLLAASQGGIIRKPQSEAQKGFKLRYHSNTGR